MTAVADNLARVRARIADACAACDRSVDDVKLIAISKGHPPEAIRQAFAAGQYVFGESTVQECLPKLDSLADLPIEWHCIGHLQSNKARFVPGRLSWLHSLDSLRLARRLASTAQERGTTLKALIEVNVTRDPAKHGIDPESLFGFIDELLRENLAALELRGLMTIGPYPSDEPEIRAAFAAVRDLCDRARERFALPALRELSMGMSGDYVAGIHEGATLLRIGSAIFGARDYSD